MPKKRAKEKVNLGTTSFKEAAKGGGRVAIVSSGHPEPSLTEDQADLIKNALVDKMFGRDEKGQYPNFQGHRFEQGLLWVRCTDAQSKEWLMRVASALAPWEGTSLALMDKDELPRLSRVTAFLPEKPAGGAAALDRLAERNQGISTRKWRIWDCNEGKGGVNLVAGVDSKSPERLRELKMALFLGRPDPDLGQVTVASSSVGGAPADSAGAPAADEAEIPKGIVGDGCGSAADSGPRSKVPHPPEDEVTP
ncbi:uncharacterized protein [Fopius arisanus]|uniref:DUF4780 domain-containing protein n=1 Tax=Fopius arisanus TaxID=64838 RepID=A0A9R1TQP5_9HYME|nr:PREDICTED: uncharacterized protein LOC105272790 [Fopius arisanus]